MSLISIIIPVYNVEAYIEECLDSVLAQTYKELEVILVDDGSTDKSSEICDQYASLDNRIHVLHQENQGLSDARNSGMAFAKGEYVTFIDSDDYIAPDMMELLYNNMKKENAQISICGAWLAYETHLEKRQKDDVYLKMDRREALRKMLDFGYYDLSAWGKLYRTELLQGIKFPSRKICEDMYVIPEVIAKAECVVYDSTPKYYYRQRQGSITKSDAFVNSYLTAMQSCTKFVTNCYPDLEKDIQCMDMFVHLMCYTTLLRNKEKTSLLDQTYQKVVEKAKGIENKEGIKDIPRKSQISLWILLHNRRIHTIVYRIYGALQSK